jgi:APA family basic amino acid/polyamine antiporter
MVGSGVFTSLGFQLMSTTNTWSIILLWVIGAVMALFGALSYAELGTHLVRSGGEYHFLSKIFHPLPGYLSGWVSLTIGFSAPIALAAMAIGAYTELFTGFPAGWLAISMVILITVFHLQDLKLSSIFQNVTTGIKVLLLLFFIICGFMITPTQSALDWDSSWQEEIWKPAFAVSFVYVTFSYSGWNAAAYIIDEIKDVKRNLPRALLGGTLIVSLLYVLINLVFLRQADLSQLAGQLEIGQVVSINMFGQTGGLIISLAISLMLISSISAMVWAGPRVVHAMAEDHPIWKYFRVQNQNGIPQRAIMLQSAISIILILTGTFEQVLIYSGFVLNLFAALAVAGIFVLRKRKTDNSGFKSPLYPFPQLVFLALSAWILLYLLYEQPLESCLGLINLLIGGLTYFVSKRYNNRS